MNDETPGIGSRPLAPPLPQDAATLDNLRTSEIRYRRLFESARDGILILDVDTRQITDVNPFMVELLGYSRNEFLGKELWQIGLLKDNDASAEAFLELQRSGYIRYEDLPLQTKWGKRREVEFVSNVYAENGHQVIQCNIRDITVRKQGERAVRESGERYAFLAESMPHKVFTTGPDGQVDYFNKLWTEYTGLAFERRGDWGWSRFVHADDVEATTGLWRRSIASGEAFECEHRFRRADGAYHWHLSRAHVMRNESGAVQMWTNSSTDIEEQKQVEAALQELMAREQSARATAEAANRTKDEFLATVSHELRTPLTVILAWAKMLRSGRFSAAETAGALATIENSATNQAQLIEDILDVSRITAGKLNLEVRPIGLARTINAALDATRLAASARTIQIQAHLDPDVGLISGDADRLQQVVSNLLTNAVKFTPVGGHIEVSLSRVQSQAQLTVRDSGQGISADFLPYVFDSFRQASSASTRAYNGLGLGLAIVRNIVEMHGGTVHADSEGENQGATFTVCIPLLPLRSRESVAHDGGQPPGAPAHNDTRFDAPPAINGLRILTVDDDPATLEMLGALLRQCGAEVKSVASAPAALEAMQQWRPDVLVSDVAMPEKDGLWLISQVRASEGQGQKLTPALALTAYVRVEDRVHVLEAGFDMFVPKPVEPAELLAAIAGLVTAKP